MHDLAVAGGGFLAEPGVAFEKQDVAVRGGGLRDGQTDHAPADNGCMEVHGQSTVSLFGGVL
jgi:hypothetical protein